MRQARIGDPFVDLDRLSLDEIRQMSKLIDLLGVPNDLQGYGSSLRILRGLVSKYEQEMAELQSSVRTHDA